MDFEFDAAKSRSNQEKHGIDFLEAQGLWSDQFRLIVPAISTDEPRFAVISKLKGKVWVGFFTVRENSIRIISVRRARKAEEELYESAGT